MWDERKTDQKYTEVDFRYNLPNPYNESFLNVVFNSAEQTYQIKFNSSAAAAECVFKLFQTHKVTAELVGDTEIDISQAECDQFFRLEPSAP